MLNKLSYNIANSLNESENMETKNIIKEDEIDNTRRASNFINEITRGEEIYLRDVDGTALLIRYAENYPEPEEYDEGYLEANGGNPEDLAAAKDAYENREVWEIIEVDENTLEPNGTTHAYVYGEKELPAYLDGLRQVNIIKRLEESSINDMTIEDMVKEYAEICDNSGMNTFEAIHNLIEYGILNTGSFRNMLQELSGYIER